MVQHGSATEYLENPKQKNNKLKSISHKKYQASSQSSTLLSKSSSGSSDTEPFYLHPPSIRTKEASTTGAGSVGMYSQRTSADHMYGSVLPNDGLYVNPMRTGSLTPTSPSGSVSSESFYLHDPQEVIYNRVKDLFDSDCSSTKDAPATTHPNALTGSFFNCHF